jgi:hypothetical protein
MEMKNIHNNPSVRQYCDLLAEFISAKGSGCDVYFNELKA